MIRTLFLFLSLFVIYIFFPIKYHSVSFYVIAGVNQSLDPDYRGLFWESQLDDYFLQYSIDYISDGYMVVNGVEFNVLPHNSSYMRDPQLCIRTSQTWNHFLDHHSDSQWYFRGTHDTYVNVRNLLKFFEQNYVNPMSSPIFAFNFHEFNDKIYPHGGAGWLISNYGIKMLNRSVNKFLKLCKRSYDDVALGEYMELLGLNIVNWQSSKFIVTWPKDENEIVLKNKWSKVKKCPINGYRLSNHLPILPISPINDAISIHMHNMSMKIAKEIIWNIPDNIAVTFLNPDSPMFCNKYY